MLPYKCAKFRVIPYFAQRSIPIPEGILAIIDLKEEDLDKIEAQPEDGTVLGHNYLMDGVRLESRK